MHKQYVFEIIMDEWPEWSGNELYDTKALAKYFGEQDYEDAFYDMWKEGFDNAKAPGEFTWEFISRGLEHLYEDGSPTGVSLKVRHVQSGV
jgi:hypothetical protein